MKLLSSSSGAFFLLVLFLLVVEEENRGGEGEEHVQSKRPAVNPPHVRVTELLLPSTARVGRSLVRETWDGTQTHTDHPQLNLKPRRRSRKVHRHPKVRIFTLFPSSYMDSRGAMHPPPPHHRQHHHHGMVVASSPAPPPAYLSPHGGAMGGSAAVGPSSGGLLQPRFPFSSLSSSTSPADQHPHHPGLEAGVFEASAGGSGFSIDSGKKKRGRPRKYTPEGNIALGLGPTASGGGGGGGGGGSGAGHFDGIGTPGSRDIPVKKNRGRPPGVGKRQMDALGSGGIGFTPHVIFVKAGEDIASKIMSFTQQGPRTVCILSANGAVSNVTLRQPSMAVGTVSYEGRFEIISISGSFIFSEDDGGRNRNDHFSVSLAGSDGRVLGGIVAGLLIAAGPVQVIVGSFISNGCKPKSSAVKTELASLAAQGQVPHSQMLNFSTAAAAAAVSPSSQGGLGESSDENSDSPVNRHPPRLFNDPRQPGGHGIQMYHHLWAGQASQ